MVDEEQVAFLNEATPLSPQAARAAVLMGHGAGDEAIKDTLNRDTDAGARTARTTVRETKRKADRLSEYDITEIGSHFKPSIPPVASFGLGGVETYVGRIATGKSTVAKIHAHELLQMDDPPAVIALDLDDMGGFDALLKNHSGKSNAPHRHTGMEKPGSDGSTIPIVPEPGEIQVWRGDHDKANQLDTFFTSLLEAVEAAAEERSHEIVIFVDEVSYYLPDGFALDRLLPDNLSLRFICTSDPVVLSVRNQSRIHYLGIDRNARMIGSPGLNDSAIRSHLNLSAVHEQWVAEAQAFNVDDPLRAVVCETGAGSQERPILVRWDVPEQLVKAVRKPRSMYGNEMV